MWARPFLAQLGEVEMSGSGQSRSGDVLQLFGVARGLEDEGRYNEAKFYRAAGLAALARATVEHPRAGQGLEAAMSDCAIQLPHDTSLRVFICRGCGEQFAGAPPGLCPTCGSGILSFMEVLPIYYLEPLEPRVILDALAETPSRMREACAGLSEEAADRGDWPLREICSHLLGAERLLVGRARRTVDEDDPDFVSVSAAEVSEGSGAPAGFADLLAGFLQQRAADIVWMKGLRPQDWTRTARHPEWGRITLAQQLGYLARHEHSHLGDLEKARIVALG